MEVKRIRTHSTSCLTKPHKFNSNVKQKHQDLYKAWILYDVRECYLPNKWKTKFNFIRRQQQTHLTLPFKAVDWTIYLVLRWQCGMTKTWQCGLTSEPHTLGLHSWLILLRSGKSVSTEPEPSHRPIYPICSLQSFFISTKPPPLSKHCNENQRINAL